MKFLIILYIYVKCLYVYKEVILDFCLTIENRSIPIFFAGKYVGNRPIKLRKSTWKDRNIEMARKKDKEKKKLGLR